MSITTINGVSFGEAAEGSPIVTSKPPACKKLYKVWGTADGYVAKRTVRNNIEQALMVEQSYIYLQDVTVEREGKAEDVWTATAVWGLQVFPVQFETGGGTAKFTHSLQTRGMYCAQNVQCVPDFNGGIGYNGESFEGVDITVPQFSWTECHTWKIQQVNWNYVVGVNYMVGKTNSEYFRSFAPGEVLFMGACGGWQKNEDECDITYRFMASPNMSNLRIPGFDFDGGQAQYIEKGGWDYLWIYYKGTIAKGKKADGSVGDNSYAIHKPVGCYVERVYDSADLNTMLQGCVM